MKNDSFWLLVVIGAALLFASLEVQQAISTNDPTPPCTEGCSGR
jgi:hypothetical protein